ncbi:MAG: PocR ligand-binding domain-containing protein [Clostridia bacterium]|nr:PocR ligand-binding domain-containing protein [Clostridia bacterium]
MIRYDLKTMKQICESLGAIANTSASFYDEKLTPQVHSERYNRTLCDAIRTNGLATCLKTDSAMLEQAKDKDEAFYYFCHFGLVELTYRVTIADKTVGYLLMGPYRDPKHTEKDLEAIKNLCQKSNFDYEELKSAYLRINEFSEKTFLAVKNILNLLFSSISRQNLAPMDGSLFEKVISPYIIEHIGDDLSLDALCKEFFLSTKQLYKIFYDAEGVTPKKYINRIRTLTARDLILNTNLSLPAIAAKVGIPDYNYFIKIFKRYDAHTPMYYRKNK